MTHSIGTQGDTTRPTLVSARVVSILAVFMLAGCGDAASGARNDSRSAHDPCELLSDRLIHANFDVDDDVVFERELSKYTPHPHCTVTWPKPDAAEIEQRQSEAMNEYLRKTMRGEVVDVPNMKTDNMLALTLFGKPHDDPERARAAFESNMKTLSDGMTIAHDGVEITFQADLRPVDGVGAAAVWAAKLRQLSVLADTGQIFHLTVESTNSRDADLSTARALALELNRLL